MFSHILRFELQYWLRQPMVYIFFLINALLVFGAVSSEDITIGQSFENLNQNAPWVIMNLYGFMSFITLIMVTAFVQASALRDYNLDTQGLMFSYPIKKFAYLIGRFAGSLLVAIIPILGVSFGILLAQIMPWVDPGRVGPTSLGAHLNGLLMFGIPNTIFIAAIIFSIATLTRSTIASFVGLIAILVGYSIAGNMLQNIDNEFTGMLADPFAIGTYGTMTKYWTVADKNTMVMGWQPAMTLNRIIWVGFSLLILLLTYFRFSFTVRKKSRKNKKGEILEELFPFPETMGPLSSPALSFNLASQWKQLINQARIDFMGIVKSVPFLVILLFGVINLGNGFGSAVEWYGVKNYPVTYIMIDIIRGNMYIFTIALIIIYSGAVVWKERDARVNEIYDTLPHSIWGSVISKLMAVLGVIVILQLLSIVTAIIAQALFGYTKFELGVYVVELLVIDFFGLAFLSILSLLIHTLFNNKYIAYFAITVLFILNFFIWQPLNIESYMVRLGQVPGHVYSDMNGFGPYVKGLAWFNIYWLLFAVILLFLTMFFWMRGLDTALGKRTHNFSLRFKGRLRLLMFGFLGLWIVSSGFVFYNTKVLNTYQTDKEINLLQAEYEKAYKQFEGMTQPRITDVKYDIAIYPKQRDLIFKGDYILKNKSDQPIDSLLINLRTNLEIKVNIDRAKQLSYDEDQNFQIYRLDPALEPGDSINMAFETAYNSKGFENEVSVTQVVANGSFFNNAMMAPRIGYLPEKELTDKKERNKYGLPERELMPELTRNCGANCMNHYVDSNSDWVNMETVISTSDDQIAIAPGSLLKEWTEGNRRYFHYKLDHPSLAYCSFISAEYQVARGEWNGVKTEVYYHDEHEYNVDKMANSIRKSLDYFSNNFSPYEHKQARIIEFPRYARFAQAYPGTMPYGESIGFIAAIEDEDDLDMVFYVVAHEMAHQWWAHQVIGAEVEGATMLSETLAQYSAIMVMEKEYGRDKMQKFLKFEMDRYLRGRGSERFKEKPLMRVDASQGYIHYRKGSVVMYYLKEMIGEENVNAALRSVIDSFAYEQPPYPTAHDLVDAFRERTPDSLDYIIEDIFETITLFDNRIKNPTVEKLENGQYKVSFTVECKKFRADAFGAQTSVPINDWIDIGLFARPENGKERGKTLVLERKKITEPNQTFEFIIDEKPYEAGVDPNYYLIDRVPEDNVKRVN